MTFDPNALGIKTNNIFGLPFTVDEAKLVIIPVPWEVTVSSSAGTARGPQAIFDASFQVDLYDPLVPNAWKIGLAMEEISKEWLDQSNALRPDVEKYLEFLSEGGDLSTSTKLAEVPKKVNLASSKLNSWVKARCLEHLQQKKIPVLVGGDHSTPLGLIEALAERHDSFGILQIDAHADLRDAYEGFTFSHASIMYNALKLSQIKKLVQVGVRDYCEDEVELIKRSENRVETFFDRDIKRGIFGGESWNKICQRIINCLPQKVYLSFDIDGLDPKLCPHTGTPVAGGFELEEVLYLIEELVLSGREIISFDINEVGFDKASNWDGNVGARALYRLANLCAKSKGVAG